MTTKTCPGGDILARIDAAEITALHWKITFISGIGFFTDADDLFIIGVVMALLKSEWHFSAVVEGLVTSKALLASAVGAVAFGRIADMLGRKRIYGYGYWRSPRARLPRLFLPIIWRLIFFGTILGIGIGGD